MMPRRGAVAALQARGGSAQGGRRLGGTRSPFLGAALRTAAREFVITRVFDAPRDLVWKAYSESERLMRWWGPNGFTMLVCKIALRLGGVFHYCMRSPDGHDMWGKWVFCEIVAPERIVSTDFFSDKEGNPVTPAHSGMSADWPAETLVTVTFAEHEGETKLTLQHTILESVAERNGAQHGWAESFDRLAEYLAKA
jgi:uncharacterized protein YndB with AHSA1/START domain